MIKINTPNFFFLLSFLFLTHFSQAKKPDEGMYPMSELKKLNLKKMGIQLTAEELFNPGGVALVDALVQISGCTGSFVSSDGLIITNHHCAFGAVAAASSVANDYIRNGFLAQSRELEIPAQGLKVRITASYEDVSDKVMNAQTKSIQDPTKRIVAIRNAIRQIEKDESAKNPDLECVVSEMFPGKVYVVFRYRTIQDIRLVYVPQRTIGEFGGESDNWVWPRHTGDFSFVRAYVSPEGKSVPFSTANVPFKPSRYLKINPSGLKEGDATFIMGYPGRTFRHQPASFLKFQAEAQMPLTVDMYDWAIDKMKELGEKNKALEIAYASRMKSLANVTKNYKGKLQGLKRTGLIAQRLQEETELLKFISASDSLQKLYSTTISDLDSLYKDQQAKALRDIWYSQLPQFSGVMAYAIRWKMENLSLLLLSDSKKREVMADSLAELWLKDLNTNDNFSAEWEKAALSRFFNQARLLPDGFRPTTLSHLFSNAPSDLLEKWIDDQAKKSIFFHLEKLKQKLSKKKGQFLLKDWGDDFLSIASDYLQFNQLINQERSIRSGKITALLPRFLEMKMAFHPSTFVPDANSTLRFTHGFIRSYQPEDAVTHLPFTTLGGMVEKSDTTGDFEILPLVKELYEKKNFGPWATADGKDVPLAFLYNLDTTGGNSGSPVLNAKGELIGVNYDRAFTATINDFAWNEAYSRSIGCDIRFVLWTLDKVANAQHILKELNVKP